MHDSEQQLIELLKLYPDFLVRNPALLTDLEIPHRTGLAVSLIERQVGVLREKLKAGDKRMRALMDIARDNERLADSRHRLSLNLLGAHDLDDVVSAVLAELGNELAAEFAVLRLFSTDQERIDSNASLYVSRHDERLKSFSTMLKHSNPVCGRCMPEQIEFMFGDNAGEIKSAAMIPLVAGAELGLIGLGSRDAARFQTALGTDFLSRLGELVAAALAVHLES
jgi:uncharacterized protein YigA (DUF484 family)